MFTEKTEPFDTPEQELFESMRTIRSREGRSIIYRNLSGNYHRVNGPAVTTFAGTQEVNPTGSLVEEYYYVNGKLHNENGPAVIYYHADNRRSMFYHVNGQKLDHLTKHE